MKLLCFVLLLPLIASAQEKSTTWKDKIQTDANRVNRAIQPLQREANSIQKHLNHLYDLENPTWKPYQGEKLSITLEPSFSFRDKSADEFSPIAEVENKLTRQRYFDQPNFRYEPSSHVKELELGLQTVFQTEYYTKPYVRVELTQIDAEQDFLRENQTKRSYQGQYRRQGLALGNTIEARKNLQINSEISSSVRTNRDQSANTNEPIYSDRIEDWGLSSDLALSEGSETWHLLPVAGLTRTKETDGVSWGQFQSLGIQKDFSKTSDNPIAKIYELGVHRVMQHPSNQAAHVTYQPYVSGHWMGLDQGNLDWQIGYQILMRRSESIKTYDPQQISTVGTFHQKKYRLNWPTRFTFGQGSNRRLNTGIGVAWDWEIWRGLTLHPSLNLEADHLYDTNKNNFGFHFSL